MPSWHEEDSVTPVIGSIIILGITVIGIAAVLIWGGPALQQIQDENAAVSMMGEFREIRRDSTVLSITDSSRVPQVNLEKGKFGIEEGTRFQISAMHDATNAACDFHVYGWDDADTDSIRYEAGGCRGTFCAAPGAAGFEVFKVTGNNAVEVTPDAFANEGGGVCRVDLPASNDVSSGDWLFQISNGGTTVYAEAWLMETQSIAWRHNGADSYGIWLELGGIISLEGNTYFLEENPLVNDEAFGTPDLIMRVPAYSGDENEASGSSTPSLFLGLVGNHLRISEDNVERVRFDFQGERAQAWCNTMLQRNPNLSNHKYTPDPDFPCTDSGPGIHSLTYESDPTGPVFGFEFIHARITTTLQP